MKIEIKNRDGHTLIGLIEKPEDAKSIVVLCHGFHSKKETESIGIIQRALNEKGIATLKYDAMGHGESYGELEDMTVSRNVNDFLDVFNYVKNLGFEKIGAHGSSFGGLTVALGACKCDLACVSLKAPVSNGIPNWTQKVYPMTLEEWKEKGVAIWRADYGSGRMKYDLCRELLSLTVYEDVKKIKCPVLIVQGTNDTSVLFEDKKKLSENISNVNFVVKEGEDHKLSLNFEKSHLEMAEWLAKNL